MTVYIGRSAQSRVYHTNEDCYKLPDEYRETTADVLEPFYDECADCTGRYERYKKRGGKHSSKLTVEDVREIRERYGDESGRALAREFGVSPSTIYEAAAGKTWAWVE